MKGIQKTVSLVMGAVVLLSTAAVCLCAASELPVGESDQLLESNAIRFETLGYLSSPGQFKNGSTYPSFTGNLRLKHQDDFWDNSFAGEAKVMLPPQNATYFFEFAEAYVGVSLFASAQLTTGDAPTAPLQIKVGRKLENWNHLDDLWELGIWQPRYRWDYLRPETVGLTGLFMTVNQPGVRFVAFGSPLFIPERGVPVTVQSGEIVSDSPWFISPPTHVSLFKDNPADTPVHYQLDTPPASQIVYHWAFSSRLELGSEEGGPWLSIGAAYKPMNQLLLAFDDHLQLASDGEFGMATIHPRVAYHKLLSLEGGYRAGGLGFWISGLRDIPDHDDTDPSWTAQQVSSSTAVSPSIDYSFDSPAVNPLRVNLSYLRQWGGFAPDAGQDANPESSNFESRYPFQNAVRLGAQSGFPSFLGNWSRRFAASGRWTHDLGHDGKILSLDFRYTPRPQWLVDLGADILGSETPMDASSSENFISRYRGHGRVYAGVTYVF